MGLVNKMDHELLRVRLISRYRRELNKINAPARKKIWQSINLTKEQKEAIDDLYFTNYGKRIPYKWHQYFTAYTGNFDPAYFPELLYIPRFEFFMNLGAYPEALSDKNLLPLLCSGGGKIS